MRGISADLRPLLAIGIAIIVAILVLTLLAGGGSGFAPTVAGHKVAKASDVLKQGEVAMNNTVAAQHGKLDPNARCYYGTLPGSHDALTSLVCGPAYFADSTNDTAWITVNFTIIDVKGNTTVDSSGTANQALAPGEKLTRPDGKQQPKTISITIPDPPAQAVGYVNMLPLGDERGLRFETPPDGRFKGPDYGLTITGIAKTNKIGEGKDACSLLRLLSSSLSRRSSR